MLQKEQKSGVANEFREIYLMTPDEYLKTILAKYSIANGSALQATNIAHDLVPYRAPG